MQSNTITSCLVAGCLLAAGSAFGQNTNAPAPGTPSTPSLNPNLRALPPRPQGGLMGILTEDQRNSYSALQKDLSSKLMELQTQLMAARQQVNDATLTDKFDENVLREKAMAAAKIEAEMVVLRGKAFAEIKPPLTSEQIEKIKSAQSPRPMQRPMMMQPPPSAGTNHNATGLPPKE